MKFIAMLQLVKYLQYGPSCTLYLRFDNEFTDLNKSDFENTFIFSTEYNRLQLNIRTRGNPENYFLIKLSILGKYLQICDEINQHDIIP